MLEQSFALHSKMFFSISFVCSGNGKSICFTFLAFILDIFIRKSYIVNMKGEIIMDNVHVKFVVLKIEEQTLSDGYKATVDVEGSFNNLEDARNARTQRTLC